MNILLFGATGQVATEIRRQRKVHALSRELCDLSSTTECAEAILSSDADIVINAAAYTAVDKAETEEQEAEKVNGMAPGRMAKACHKKNIPLIHISTDYVFGGEGADPLKPEDNIDPRNAYGRTKLAGERAIQNSECEHVILRTSWVFSAHGNNFLKTMLRLGKERDALSIVGDQIGGPTPASAIAEACFSIADQFYAGNGKSGTYHFSGQPFASWADFARAIFDRARYDVIVEDIPSSAFPTPAARPKNSRLDCSSLFTDYSIAQPDWRAAIDDIISEMEQQL